MAKPPTRSSDLRRALSIEYLSLGYNAIEAVVGLIAGIAAASVALIGFGLDSLVESSSAAILVWRLRAEMHGESASEDAERRAVRLVAIAFFALAAYVGFEALRDLVRGTRPEASAVGLAIAALSLVIMPLLAHFKRRSARALNSRALQADSRQTTLCTYLSAFVLIGVGANALFGWWWADPTAGLFIAGLAAREGWELRQTEDFC
jgi:divalent metal cation (Fe/Co/Zn/Cd) transporter